MDSLSQIALGSAVGIAVMGRRTAVWKSALWGAVCGTLPDLDVFVDHGDAIRNMVMHRSESHALFWLALLSLPLAALIARLHGEWALWRRWWLAVGLALETHPLLDAMTVYGTRLLLPFTDQPYAVGSIFIIDPLYTVPLLVGGVWALAARGSAAGLKANAAGLVLSTAYLAWSAAAQAHVERVATAALRAQGVQATQVLVTPTAFNTLLWRVVAIEGDQYHEGFRSLLDGAGPMHFDRFPRGLSLMPEVQAIDGVRRVTASAGATTSCTKSARASPSPTCAWARSPPTPSASRWPSATARPRRCSLPSRRAAGPTCSGRWRGCGGGRWASHCRRRAEPAAEMSNPPTLRQPKGT
jgi:inner membrane protein